MQFLEKFLNFLNYFSWKVDSCALRRVVKRCKKKNRKIQDISIRSLNPLFHRHIMYDLLNTARTVVIWKVI